ncbi:hypothetical protein C8Q78DRAFT_1066981 [Trametes maxima]|nr:hypothetical protein C8Q78DRAFT_1066981 [Trametes maxima]
MQLSIALSAVAVVAGAIQFVRAEQHTIRFENKCGKGTPQLIQGGKVLSTGQDYTSNGPFSAGIAYLQTGGCGFNGENCSLLEMTLVNPTAPGAGSSTDISLINPHAFNVVTSFSYFGGCDGQGATCADNNCKTAFFVPDDNQVQVQCETENVNLLITFCGDATSSSALNTSGDKKTTSSEPAYSPVPQSHSSSDVVAHTSAVTHVTTSPSATHAATSATVSSEPSFAAQPSSIAVSTAAASVPSCKAGSRRRGRSTSPEVNTTPNRIRRHHARNAEAAGRGTSF